MDSAVWTAQLLIVIDVKLNTHLGQSSQEICFSTDSDEVTWFVLFRIYRLGQEWIFSWRKKIVSRLLNLLMFVQDGQGRENTAGYLQVHTDNIK